MLEYVEFEAVAGWLRVGGLVLEGLEVDLFVVGEFGVEGFGEVFGSGGFLVDEVGALGAGDLVDAGSVIAKHFDLVFLILFGIFL